MPKVTDTQTVRGVPLDLTNAGDRKKFSGIRDIYSKGAIVEEQAFVSSSFSEQKAFQGAVQMRINGKTGVDIGLMAKYPEQEVLFMPGTRFYVNKVETVDDRLFITLTEVE